jgi:hypothetical protein
MTEQLLERLDDLVPIPDRDGNWHDVLVRAGEARSARPRSRRMVLAVAGVVGLLAVVLFATPAFGLRSALLGLIGRTNVPFSSSKMAPNRIKKQYLDLGTRLAQNAFGRPIGTVMAREARDAGTFTINGHARRLWVVPVSGGGFCYEFERVGGSCVADSAERRMRPMQISFFGGPGMKVRRVPATHRVTIVHPALPEVTRILGTITAPDASLLQIVYADGTRVTIPFVWVTRPIAAGFFSYDVPTERLTGPARPTALVLSDARGKELAREAIVGGKVRQVYPAVQSVSHPATALPKASTVLSAPLQRGTGDATSVVVGRNGVAVFDLRGTSPDRIRAGSPSLAFECFRITKEFGILGLAGGFASAAPGPSPGEVRVYVGARGPFDGCDISAGGGHVWPDRFGSHAPVEIALTPAGRTYFANRAAARDLALFVHSARLREAWHPGGERLAAALAATFGSAVTRLHSAAAPLAAGHVGYVLVPDGATFVERSTTGKRFTVTIVHHFIAHQNLPPYSKATLFWKK